MLPATTITIMICIFIAIVITACAMYIHTRENEMEQEMMEIIQAYEQDNKQQKKSPQPKNFNQQPTKEELHKVINFMHSHNIIDHKTHDEIIRKSLPYIM